jgi:hypothetical protein
LGLAWPWLIRLGISEVPGDFHVQQPGFSFCFPLTSGILVAIALSLLRTVMGWFWRR